MVVAVAAFLASGTARAADDALEGFNRQMFAFNNAVVRNVIDPVGATLDAWVPGGLRRMGTNMYANLVEPEVMVSNLITGNYSDAGAAAGRFAINSTVGLAGAFDAASAVGLERRQGDLGAALCHAGLPSGSYLVVPLVGPTSVATASAVTGFFVLEWNVLNLISTLLATADAVVDISVSAAALKDAGDVPQSGADPYVVQREAFWADRARTCGSETAPQVAAAPRK